MSASSPAYRLYPRRAEAVPSTFRWWGLKRKQECGSPCHACAVGCDSQAIDKNGRIAHIDKTVNPPTSAEDMIARLGTLKVPTVQ